MLPAAGGGDDGAGFEGGGLQHHVRRGGLFGGAWNGGFCALLFRSRGDTSGGVKVDLAHQHPTRALRVPGHLLFVLPLLLLPNGFPMYKFFGRVLGATIRVRATRRSAAWVLLRNDETV